MVETALEIPEILNIGFSKDRTAQTSGAPLPPGTRVVSVDDHILEPPDLWLDRLPAKFRDKAPRLERDHNNGYRVVIPGVETPHLAGINFCAFECVPGILDMEARIRDMDAEGVEKQLLFPQKSLGLIRLPDEELRMACMTAYNEYLAEVQAKYAGRLYGVGLLRWWRPDAVRDHIQELKAMGFKTILSPGRPGGDLYYNSRRMEPFWEAVEEAGLPLCFHIGENMPGGGRGGAATNAFVSIGGFRFLWGQLTFAGVFDRHPGVRVAFIEGGISWVPGALHDADMIYETYKPDMDPVLSHLPSHYWFQNCYASFMADPPGLELLHRIGAGRAMWSSDYPHNEGTFGYSRSAVAEVFRYAGEEDGKRIVGQNAIDLFGLDS